MIDKNTIYILFIGIMLCFCDQLLIGKESGVHKFAPITYVEESDEEPSDDTVGQPVNKLFGVSRQSHSEDGDGSEEFDLDTEELMDRNVFAVELDFGESPLNETLDGIVQAGKRAMQMVNRDLVSQKAHWISEDVRAAHKELETEEYASTSGRYKPYGLAIDISTVVLGILKRMVEQVKSVGTLWNFAFFYKSKKSQVAS